MHPTIPPGELAFTFPDKPLLQRKRPRLGPNLPPKSSPFDKLRPQQASQAGLRKIHLRPTVSTPKIGDKVPTPRERLLWASRSRGRRLARPEHTHLRVDVVQRVDAGILWGRGARQLSVPPAPPHPERTQNSVRSPLSQHRGETGKVFPAHHGPPSAPQSPGPRAILHAIPLSLSFAIYSSWSTSS